MSRTRIKICGITRNSDALAAVEAGADALGLVFYAESPRAVTVSEAQHIIHGLPPMVTLVGLFVNASAELVREAYTSLPLGLLQFHGDEDAHYCAAFERPWMKAIRVANDSNVAAMMLPYEGASALLLDTYKAGTPGGTGDTFNWDQAPSQRKCPLVLAGGLNPKNVAAAVAAVRPYAVDVSGGVEQSPGIKDYQKMSQFVSAVRSADLAREKSNE